MQSVILNLFPVNAKSQFLFLYRISQTKPVTKNRTTRYRLAAQIAKEAAKTQGPIFSVGDFVYSSQEIDTDYHVELNIEGTKVPFEVQLEQNQRVSLSDIEFGVEKLVNRLVDWYYQETIPNSFRMENVNYIGQNIFKRIESRLYKTYKINVNEGMIRATRIFSGKPYLLLDLDYRVTWGQTLWDSLKIFVKNVLNRDVYLPAAQTIQAINEKFGRTDKKRGVIVQGKNQIGEYEVIEFDFSKNPDTPGTAGEKSQCEYFSNVYGSALKIKDPKQPLVRVRVTRGYHRDKENYHVPELLEFGRIPRHFRENQRLMSALANIEKPIPRGRYSQIISFVQGDPFGTSKGFAQDDFVKRFVDVSNNPVEISAKILPSIKVKMRDNTFKVSNDSDFLGKIWKNKFHRTPDVKKVTLLYCVKREDDILDFYSKLKTLSEDLGMALPDPESITVEEDSIEEFLKALNQKVDTDLVISFVPLEGDGFYDKLKEFLLVKHGVLHQNISYEKTIDRIIEYERRGNKTGIKSILTLIAMQLCAKLGGAPWAFFDPIYNANWPIIGLDVWHNKNTDRITGGCAAFDPYGEYLYSEAKVTNLNDLLTSALGRYLDNFSMPEGLVILRDGLSFTQEQEFLLSPNGELDIVDEVLANLGFNNSIFVMEKKGTRLRIFKKLDAYKVENPDPGTVIIGEPFENNEMLMVSQETYQGTVNPVFYKVIRPENPEMGKIANTVNKLCRHHWNTNKSVKIPAPSLHADRITYLIRRVLKGAIPNQNILDKPFYL